MTEKNYPSHGQSCLKCGAWWAFVTSYDGSPFDVGDLIKCEACDAMHVVSADGLRLEKQE